MTKIRVYEYARSKNVQSKLIISKLSDMGYQVKGHMSVLEGDMVNKLDKMFNTGIETPKLTNRESGSNPKADDKPTTDNKTQGNASRPNSNRPVRQQAYSSDRPQGQRPQGDRPQGGYQNRQGGGYQGQRPQGDRPQGGYQNRQGGGYQGQRPQGDRPQGGYQNRQGGGYQGQRPQGDRPQGEYQNRQGGGYQGQRPQGDRPQGGYQNRQGGGYQGQRPQGDRPQGGYQNRQGGGYQGQRPQGDRPQGGYQNRQGGGYQGQRPQGDRPQGGYQNRQGGGYQGQRPQGDRPQGGYQNRQGQGQGGYQNRQGQGQGGYQNRQGQGQGGYQNRQGQGQGGYQNRQGQGQGGYQNRQGQGQGGYQNRQGQGQGQGGYQNRQGQGQGGYQNRQGGGQGGMTPPAASHQPQSSGASNYNRPNKPVGRSYQSKKIAEEKRREEERIFGKKNQQVEKKVRELPTKITYTDSLTVAELGKKLYREPSEIIKKLFMMGAMATINSSLDKDAIELVCTDYGVEVEEIIVIDQTDLDAVIADDDVALNTFERPAVVTIMGHVDHGKTTLLDSIRKTKVTEGEAGGITQHIGAYQVDVMDKKITFLDTPGHAAFTTMRARGAKVTDVTILVVAGDDGVKPQTVEAINHAKDAKCPIIIAVNKMDKPEANLDRVKTELSQYGIVPEEWGGDNIFVPISARNGDGIEDLLETILLVSEVAELKCNKDRLALGTVIEAHLDKGKGPVATLLVQNGTLRVGDPIVVGNAFGRVRAMIDDNGKKVKEALPSTPIELTGLNEVPHAGDRFVVFEDEKTARSVGEQRATNHLLASRDSKAKVTLDNLFEQLKDGEVRELNVIVKADVQGSQEALIASLMKIEVEGVRVKTVHAGVGAISESDVLLAKSSGSIIIGFNVRPDVNAKRTADAEKVDLRIHNIIYNVISEIEQAMTGMLDPEFEEVVTGQAEVRQLVKISKVGTIAGSYVTEGKIVRDAKVRIIRGGVVVHEGDLNTLKRFKDDVKEVAAGYECGIAIKGYNALEEGDVIEAYVMQEIERKK